MNIVVKTYCFWCKGEFGEISISIEDYEKYLIKMRELTGEIDPLIISSLYECPKCEEICTKKIKVIEVFKDNLTLATGRWCLVDITSELTNLGYYAGMTIMVSEDILETIPINELLTKAKIVDTQFLSVPTILH